VAGALVGVEQQQLIPPETGSPLEQPDEPRACGWIAKSSASRLARNCRANPGCEPPLRSLVLVCMSLAGHCCPSGQLPATGHTTGLQRVLVRTEREPDNRPGHPRWSPAGGLRRPSVTACWRRSERGPLEDGSQRRSLRQSCDSGARIVHAASSVLESTNGPTRARSTSRPRPCRAIAAPAPPAPRSIASLTSARSRSFP
jgi:hypothetical protein